MTYSVVIITRNEESYLGGCLQSLQRSISPDNWEVVIVDGGSTDGTEKAARGWAERSGVPLTWVDSRPGYSLQRNLGLAAARGEWVVFLSADVRVPADWAAGLVAALDESVDVAVGRSTVVADGGRGGWLADATPVLYRSSGSGPVERVSTVHFAVRRRLALAVGFDERVAACEDKDFLFRLGLARPDAVIGGIPAGVEHVSRDAYGRVARKVYRESKELRRLRASTGGRFPDCFGWAREADSFSRGLVPAALLAVGATVDRRPAAAAAVWAAAVALAAAWRWRRRSTADVGVWLRCLPLAAAVVAGQWVGALTSCPGDDQVGAGLATAG